jgi:adenine phosphoribosyltransferase
MLTGYKLSKRKTTVACADSAILRYNKETKKIQVLLIQKKVDIETDKYQFPGGHVELSDLSAAFAAHREAIEETGVKLNPFFSYILGSALIDDSRYPVLSTLCAFVYESGEVGVAFDDAATSKWFDVSQETFKFIHPIHRGLFDILYVKLGVDGLLDQVFYEVLDHPKPGIIFKDLSKMLEDNSTMEKVALILSVITAPLKPTVIVGVESRGFLLSPIMAKMLNTRLVLCRKKGKLPPPVKSYTYDLEYGSDTLEIKEGAVSQHDRILIHDDILATGGTISAVAELVGKESVVGFSFIYDVEIGGKANLIDTHISSINDVIA